MIRISTAGEIIKYLNEQQCNVYELSKQLGLGKTTLRARLKKLGYDENPNGVWVYKGDYSLESSTIDVVTNKRLVVAKDVPTPTMVESLSNIHEALMHLNLTKKPSRTTISLRSHQIEAMKQLADSARLRLNDVYSLAIEQFLARYDMYLTKKED